MRPKKKTAKARPRRKSEQAKLLAAIVKSKGSGSAVSQELGCSQQSVSEWAAGAWPPRAAMQEKMFRLYGIPKPWPVKEASS